MVKRHSITRNYWLNRYLIARNYRLNRYSITRNYRSKRHSITQNYWLKKLSIALNSDYFIFVDSAKKAEFRIFRQQGKHSVDWISFLENVNEPEEIRRNLAKTNKFLSGDFFTIGKESRARVLGPVKLGVYPETWSFRWCPELLTRGCRLKNWLKQISGLSF